MKIIKKKEYQLNIGFTHPFLCTTISFAFFKALLLYNRHLFYLGSFIKYVFK